MLTQLFTSLFITGMISLSGVYSYSACDDIDIHFIIDTDSIIQNSGSIEKFIQSIIWNGTSEYTAISIALYGNHVPSEIASSCIIISLHETHSIYQRAHHEQKILSQLRNTFEAITFYTSAKQTNISLLDAFTHSNDQHKPMRVSKKESVFARNKQESEKIDEYFIFDHYNNFLSDTDDVCSMMYHDRVRDQNIHFIMGQTFAKSIPIRCNNGGIFYDRVNHRTFFALSDIMDITNNKQMEVILDITCPTHIDIDEDYEYGAGDLSLGNHVQWIDTDDIQKCKLVEIQNDDITKPFQIDSKLSFIQIKNYNHAKNDNTYKINDYLLVHKPDLKLLTKLGCWSQVYKIVDIEQDIVESQANLFVSLPTSPTEYIIRANVSGLHPLFSIRNTTKTPSKSAKETPESRQLLTRYIRNGPARDLFSNVTSGSFQLVDTSLTTPKTIDLGYPWYVDIAGRGSINATIDFSFDIDVDLNFNFDWNLLEDSIYLYYTLNADYAFSIDLDLEFEGPLNISIDDLIKYGRYNFFSLGPVPVVIKPFIDIDLSLTSLPNAIDVGLSCIYSSYDQIGYEYYYQNNYIPNFEIIKADTKYLLAIIRQWEDIINIEDCASLSFSVDNNGTTCRFFDYNPATQLCRCAGTGPIAGFTDSDVGTNAYVLDLECGDIYNIDCQLLTTCNIGDITVSSSIDGCGLGLISYECISCINSPGTSEVTTSQDSIEIRTPSPDNGCSYTEASLDAYDLDTCPRLKDATDSIGFDTKIDIAIGANLYSIIIVYLRGILNVPLRINAPEFNDDVCDGASVSCAVDAGQAITASIDVLMNLTAFLGVDVDVTSLIGIVDNLVNLGIEVDIDGLDFESPSIESLLGVFEILPLTNLGCLPFEGDSTLDEFDALFRGLCCVFDSETGQNVPIFIDDNNNGIDDRSEPFDDDSESNANTYKVSVFVLLSLLIGNMINVD